MRIFSIAMSTSYFIYSFRLCPVSKIIDRFYSVMGKNKSAFSRKQPRLSRLCSLSAIRQNEYRNKK